MSQTLNRSQSGLPSSVESGNQKADTLDRETTTEILRRNRTYLYFILGFHLVMNLLVLLLMVRRPGMGQNAMVLRRSLPFIIVAAAILLGLVMTRLGSRLWFHRLVLIVVMSGALTLVVIEDGLIFDATAVALFVFLNLLFVMRPSWLLGMDAVMLVALFVFELLPMVEGMGTGRATYGHVVPIIYFWGIGGLVVALGLNHYRDTTAVISSRTRIARQLETIERLTRARATADRILRHDVRNPMGAIYNMTELLEMDADNPDSVQEYARVIRSASLQSLDLMENSLDLAALESGTYEPKRQRLCLSRVVRSGADLVTHQAKAHQVNMVVDLEEGTDACVISGEEGKLKSMFTNLIRNAVEACGPGDSVTVTCGRTDRVEVRIHNPGVVPQQIRDRLFERNVTAGKEHGTGLGTYSAKLIAEAHGGSIWFTSASGEGTTFTVALPAG